MKELKHIKLFEAFESQKLSKTLKFINKASKDNFLNQIKKIAAKIDYPISELSDDLFEYLPFMSALKKVPVEEKVVEEAPQECNHESDWISGEYCKGGLVKRTWGRGTRVVTCPYCGGSGFKSDKRSDRFKKPAELSYIKFWFDKDGKYIIPTGTDGNFIKQSVPRERLKLEGSFSRDIADYTTNPTPLSIRDVKELPTGTIVKVNINHNRDLIGMVWRGVDDYRCYIIQDKASGSEDPNSQDWKKYGSVSWIITGNADMQGNAYVLEPKTPFILDDKSKVEEKDPFGYNNVININYLSVDSYKDMEKRLQGAHFAIVLDFKKMKGEEYTKVEKTQGKRVEGRKGALALIKPKDVKNANIQRYIQGLVDRFNIGNGLQEINKVIPRAFGWNNCITFILRSINTGELDSLITELYRFIESDFSIFRTDKEYEEEAIRNRIRNMYKNAGAHNQIINAQIEASNKSLDTLNGYGRKIDPVKARLVFTSYLELGEILNKKITSLPCETLADLEVIMQKMNAVKMVFYGNRFPNLAGRLKYPINYLSQSDTSYNFISELMDYYGHLDIIIKELEEFKRFVEKV